MSLVNAETGEVVDIAESRTSSMLMYAVQGASGGPVKIGRTGNLDQRMRQLQTGHPEILRLLAVTSELLTENEATVHEDYRRHRIHGEWFDMGPWFRPWSTWLPVGAFDDAIGIAAWAAWADARPLDVAYCLSGIVGSERARREDDLNNAKRWDGWERFALEASLPNLRRRGALGHHDNIADVVQSMVYEGVYTTNDLVARWGAAMPGWDRAAVERRHVADALRRLREKVPHVATAGDAARSLGTSIEEVLAA